MRRSLVLMATAALSACNSEPSQPSQAPLRPAAVAIAFDGAPAPDAAARLARGERIAAVLGCTGCHGKDLTGEDWSEPGFGRLWTANLTRSAARYDDRQLARIIQSGARPDRDLWEMPSHLFTQLAPEDMADLLAFLRSKPRTGPEHPAPQFEDSVRKEIAAGTFKSSRTQVAELGSASPPDAGAGHALGRYIVRATCAECHGMDLRGGQPHPEATPRPDLRVMVAAYDPEQFERLLRTGKAAGEREVSLMSEVARGRYTHLTDAELDAVYRYLRRVAETAP